MKKTLALALSLLMALSLFAGCDGGTPPATDAEATETVEVVAEAEETAEIAVVSLGQESSYSFSEGQELGTFASWDTNKWLCTIGESHYHWSRETERYERCSPEQYQALANEYQFLYTENGEWCYNHLPHDWRIPAGLKELSAPESTLHQVDNFCKETFGDVTYHYNGKWCAIEDFTIKGKDVTFHVDDSIMLDAEETYFPFVSVVPGRGVCILLGSTTSEFALQVTRIV